MCGRSVQASAKTDVTDCGCTIALCFTMWFGQIVKYSHLLSSQKEKKKKKQQLTVCPQRKGEAVTAKLETHRMPSSTDVRETQGARF